MIPIIRSRPRPVTSPVSGETPGIGHNREYELRLQIEYVAPAVLKLPRRQTKRHPKKQIAQIAAGIAKFGMIRPIVIDEAGAIVSGVACFEAAKQLAMATVPVIRVAHLSEVELRFFALADNKLAEGSSWDTDVLAIEIQDLLLVDNLEIELTGFETVEIERLVMGIGDGEVAETEEVPEPDGGEPVSRLGDVFRIGEHMLVCGDGRDAATYEALMGGERARMVFADLPYNVKIAGNVSGLGKKKHREFMHASGEMTRGEFTGFMRAIMERLADHSMPGAIHFLCMDWRHQLEMMEAGEVVYGELKNLLVWAKTNGGMGAFYRSQHELIYAWKVGGAAHLNNFGLGAGGRYRTNVLTYPGCNTFRKDRDEDLAAHSTVKPTQLVADLIRDVSRLGEIVLDPCGGSGTTLLAAERVKRRARLIEIDPKYVDVAVCRAQDRLGLTAIHSGTGLDFAALAESRGISRDGGAA